MAYLFWSGISLGVLGFLSLGMVGPILFGGHGRRGGGQGQEGILLLVVVVGIVRTFFMIYSFVKNKSGKLLERFERMVVEVGEPAPAPAPVPAPVPCAALPPSEAALAAGIGPDLDLDTRAQAVGEAAAAAEAAPRAGGGSLFGMLRQRLQRGAAHAEGE